MIGIFRDKAGDTIVEVLLATVVMGVIIGGAYNLANRSLIINQNSSERTVAVNLIREQLEIVSAVGGDFSCPAGTPPGEEFHMSVGDTAGQDIERRSFALQPSDSIYSLRLTCDDISAGNARTFFEVRAEVNWEGIGSLGPQTSISTLRVGR